MDTTDPTVAVLLAENARMRQALTASAMRFIDYEAQHRAKGTPEADAKAQANADMASMIAGVLTDGAASYQKRVAPWMAATFPPEVAVDMTERCHRFLEEALELVQALGATEKAAYQLVRYVFTRDVGEKVQETGGVLVCLAALCNAAGIDMEEAGERELARVWTMVEKIRAKHAAKPKYAALPGGAPDPAAKPWQWYVGHGSMPDSYDLADGAMSRDEAVAWARREGYDGTFSICEAYQGDIRVYAPDGDSIMDETMEDAEDDGAFGDGDGEWRGTPKDRAAAAKHLDLLLEVWADANAPIFPRKWAFEEQRHGEVIEP